MYNTNYQELYHHGINGQKWGVRRFQNEDGSLTSAGRRRYNKNLHKYAKTADKLIDSGEKAVNKAYKYEKKLKKSLGIGDEYNTNMNIPIIPKSKNRYVVKYKFDDNNDWTETKITDFTKKQTKLLNKAYDQYEKGYALRNKGYDLIDNYHDYKNSVINNLDNIQSGKSEINKLLKKVKV